MTRPHFVYPVVGILALAAWLPIVAPWLFVDSRAAALTTARPDGPAVLSATLGARAAAPAPERTAASGDERWWRGQAARVLTTISVLSVPKGAPARPAQPPPAPPSVESLARPAGPVEAGPVAAPEPRLTARVPARIRRWEPLILRAARKYDVDPALIAAVMMTESSGDAAAVSPRGAVGLMQVLDGPTDPEANIEVGVGILASHLRRFGSLDLALAAYNAGVGNVLDHGGVPPFQETRDHIARTLASYTAWRAV